jgi:hypothetical protein
VNQLPVGIFDGRVVLIDEMVLNKLDAERRLADAAASKYDHCSRHEAQGRVSSNA